MRSWQMLLSVGFGFTLASSSKGDSWAAPHRFESSSENGSFVAVIEPGGGTNKATVTVFRVSGTNRTEAWRADLSNPIAPTAVVVCDDGHHVVTLNNWGGVGYGDDVVALYDSRGQLARYALEEFALPPRQQTNSSPPNLLRRLKEAIGLSGQPTTPTLGSFRSGYHSLFRHSTSSRHWDADSIQLFWPQTNSDYFCLWLDWDRRWVAWKLRDGSLFTPSTTDVVTWNAEGRRRSIRAVESARRSVAALNFLGRLRIKEDRPLIENWLRDPQFNTGNRQSSSSDSASVRFVLMSYSDRRQRADEILAQWDGVAIHEPGVRDSYTFLGTVEGVVKLPTSPEKGKGFLRIQLLPRGSASAGLDFRAQAAQHLVADLQWQRPTSFSGGRSKDLPLGTNIEFAIYGVIPGMYLVQAMWDKQMPFCDSTNAVCEPSRGDFISTKCPSVRVEKGKTTSHVVIDCRTLAE